MHEQRRVDMSPDRPSELYDAEYYRTGCGPFPYERSAPWLATFRRMAEEIVRSLHPKRVLDAGCALGMLVEAFWDLGVFALGIDVSEFAIANVRRDMRPYCRVGSLIEPLTERFDLIACIEVLEHMTSDEAVLAMQIMSAATDTVLFSSTPDDFNEPTHVNVKPPQAWLSEWAMVGFFPDVAYDASFISPQAMLLRRSEPIPEPYLGLFASRIRLACDLFEAKAQAEKSLHTLQTQLEIDRARAITLEDIVSDTRNEITKLNRLNAEFEKSRDLLAVELDAERRRASTLEQEAFATREELKKLNRLNFEFERSRHSTAFELESERKRAATLERFLAETRGELNKLNALNADFEAAREAARRDLESERERAATLEQIVSETNAELKKLNAINADFEAAREAVKRDLDTERMRAATLEQIVADTGAELKKVNAINADFEAAREAAKRDLDTERKRAATLEQIVSETRDELNKLNRLNADFEKARDLSAVELDEERRRAATLEQALSATQEEIKKLNRLNFEFERSRDSIKFDLEAERKRAATLERIVSETREAVAAMQRSEASAVEELKVLKSINADLEGMNLRLEAYNSDLEANLAELRTHTDVIEDKLGAAIGRVAQLESSSREIEAHAKERMRDVTASVEKKMNLLAQQLARSVAREIEIDKERARLASELHRVQEEAVSSSAVMRKQRERIADLEAANLALDGLESLRDRLRIADEERRNLLVVAERQRTKLEQITIEYKRIMTECKVALADALEQRQDSRSKLLEEVALTIGSEARVSLARISALARYARAKALKRIPDIRIIR